MGAYVVQILLAGAFVIASALLWQDEPAISIAILVLGTALLLILRWRAMRGNDSQKVETTPADEQRAARFAVTQLLGQLTRVQVAYLCQAFSSERMASQWLKQALPRSLRGAAPSMKTELERARYGDFSPRLHLVGEIIALQQRLVTFETALDEIAKRYPDHAVARPVIFVATEAVDADDPDSRPLVVSVAGLNPKQKTLVPEVDAVTVFAQEGRVRQVIGQVAFAAGDGTLNRELRCVSDKGDVRIYVNTPVDSYDDLKIPVARMPMGFLIGSSEFL